MLFKLPSNIDNVKSLDELSKVVAEGFKVLENLLTGGNTLYSIHKNGMKMPKGTDLRRGDILIDQRKSPTVIKEWDGKRWMGLVVSVFDDTGSPIPVDTGIPEAPEDGTIYGRKDGAWVAAAAPSEEESGCCELLVADGIDSPPEFLYNEDGTDYLYSDPD